MRNHAIANTNAIPSIIHAPISLKTGRNRFGMLTPNRFGMLTPNRSTIKCENAAIATPVMASVLKTLKIFFKTLCLNLHLI